MKTVEPPQSIELTAQEQTLADQIRFDLDPNRDHDEILSACELTFELMQSLFKRDAIPEIRWEYFIDAEHNPGPGKSRLVVFEANGTTGDDILRHPDFWHYHLRWFLHGPQLPRETIAGFCRIINEDRGTSGMVRDDLRSFARAEMRKHRLDKEEAPEAFYLLALECDQRFNARSIRDATKSAR